MAPKQTTKPAARPPATEGRLARYRHKRDFSKTPEPRGETPAPSPPPADGCRFVVQRHRARRLHYDLRLEAGGVLLSWAVPKGPTLDPAARHLAVHVEDHPLDYFDFEGVIPAGEYGGGDVIVWDWGTWSPADDGTDVLDAVEKGALHFDLNGEKLAGRFVLVRRTTRDGPGQDSWLLLHKRDEHAMTGWDPEDHPTSVKSGRTNEEVAAAPDAQWHNGRSETARAPGTVQPPTDQEPTNEELAALDDLRAPPRRKVTWPVQGRDVLLTNLDKVLFPATGDAPPTTKRELVRYYTTMAPAMLPYLAGRAVNLLRHPDGVDRKGFWQKAVPPGTPGWVTQWRNEEADPGETEVYMVVDCVPTLAWVANLAAIELNPWTSCTDGPHEPTWALVDIDPGTDSTFDDVLVLARLYRTALDHLGVRGMPKLTGKRGVQIWIPVRGGYSFADTRSWVEQLSRAVGRTVPELVSWEWEKRKRGGKARLDYTQNAVNKTLVAPFSTRPAAGAPVSMPITWEELDEPALRPDAYDIRNAPTRLARSGDPLAELIGLQQELPTL